MALATVHGDWFWGATISGIYAVKPTGGVDERAFKVSDSECDTDWFRGLAWSQGTLYAVKKDVDVTAVGAVGGIFTQPSVFAVGGAVGAAPPTSSPAPEPSVLPGAAASSSTNHHSAIFESPTSLYITNYAGDATLYHYVDVAGTWTLDSGYPIAHAEFQVDGATKKMYNGRGVTGYTDGVTGHYTLVYSAGSYALGYLLKFDTVARTFSILATGPAGTLWHGVALSPSLLRGTA